MFIEMAKMGVALGNGARALSEAELQSLRNANYAAARQASPAQIASYMLGAVNWNPIPQRPLNERFAEFKERLAKTRAKYPHLS